MGGRDSVGILSKSVTGRIDGTQLCRLLVQLPAAKSRINVKLPSGTQTYLQQCGGSLVGGVGAVAEAVFNRGGVLRPDARRWYFIYQGKCCNIEFLRLCITRKFAARQSSSR